MSSTRDVFSQITAAQPYGYSLSSIPSEEVVKPDISEEVDSYDRNIKPVIQNTLLRLMLSATEAECKDILEACKLVRPAIAKLAFSFDGEFDHASAWHAIVAQLEKLDVSVRLEYLRSLQHDSHKTKITYALQQLMTLLAKHHENDSSCHLEEIFGDRGARCDGHLPNLDIVKAIMRSWSSAQLAENMQAVIENGLDDKAVHHPISVQAYAKYFLKTVKNKLSETSVLQELTQRLLSEATPATLAALQGDAKFAQYVPKPLQAESAATQDSSNKKRK